MLDQQLKEIYRAEREHFWSLEIPLDAKWASRWYLVLSEHFQTQGQGISFGYVLNPGDQHPRGSTHPHDACEYFPRRAAIYLYPPYFLRTLGHEFCHALRWIKHGKRGHGDTWLEDLAEVHHAIGVKLIRHRPQLELPLFYENQWRRRRDEFMYGLTLPTIYREEVMR